MATLSVVIPTYNRGPLACQAIDSVLAQESVADIELIVVDDGSTDDTRRLIEAYGSAVAYIHQPNRGMNAARNRGIAASSGDLVALLDSDDVWLPFKTRVQLEVMRRLDSVGFTFSNFFIWRNDVRIPDGLGTWMEHGASLDDCALEKYDSAQLGIESSGAGFSVAVCDIYTLSLFQPVVLPSTTLVRRSVLRDLGPLPEDNWMCGDWEYFARASKRFGAAYIDIETTLNRSHDDAVRLMRRSLADRTRLRIESIARTWGSDVEFMARRAADVARVESDQWETLCKLACYAGQFVEAARYRTRVESLRKRVSWKLRLLSALTRLPGSVKLLRALRGTT